MVAGTNPSPKVILHGFVLVTMRVLNSYDIKIIRNDDDEKVCNHRSR